MGTTVTVYFRGDRAIDVFDFDVERRWIEMYVHDGNGQRVLNPSGRPKIVRLFGEVRAVRKVVDSTRTKC